MSDRRPARDALAAVAARALPGPPVPSTARVALHLHPDVDLAGRPVLASILAQGAYLSQFVTGTSNGGLTAVPGGDRWRWEHRMFGGAYDDVPARDRPVYGALALDADPYGPAPRFGSSWLRLRPAVLSRSSLAYPDSVFEPTAVGVAGRAGVLELFRQDRPADPLDHYVEVHVHGGVAVPDDVAALVLDPSFRGTGPDDAARAAGLTVEWHAGFRVPVDAVAAFGSYRDPSLVGAARSVARNGVLTPAVLGAARRAGELDLQTRKWLWHCLARFGRRSSAEVPGAVLADGAG